MKIKSIKKQHEKKDVYDIAVKDARHYILHNGVVSHNSYVPTKQMSGGGGLKYIASTIVFLSKSKERDTTTKDVIGARIKCATDKSRFTRENQKIEVLLDFSKGLDRYHGLLEIGLAAGVIEKTAKKWKFPDGSEAFEKHIYKNPEKFFTPDVLEQIDHGARQMFHFGSGKPEFEEGDDDEISG